MKIKGKHIQWQTPADFYRTSFFVSKRKFDAIILIESYGGEFETISVFRWKQNDGNIYSDTTVAEFKFNVFDSTKIKQWALIEYQYT